MQQAGRTQIQVLSKKNNKLDCLTTLEHYMTL